MAKLSNPDLAFAEGGGALTEEEKHDLNMGELDVPTLQKKAQMHLAEQKKVEALKTWANDAANDATSGSAKVALSPLRQAANSGFKYDAASKVPPVSGSDSLSAFNASTGSPPLQL